jgi:hypothetical protein
MNNLTKACLLIVVIGIGLIGAKLTQLPPPKPNPEFVTVNKRDLYEMTYEWAMYRECAILLYVKVHNVTKEEATAHLEAGVKNAVEKQFISWYENRQKWEKHE